MPRKRWIFAPGSRVTVDRDPKGNVLVVIDEPPAPDQESLDTMPPESEDQHHTGPFGNQPGAED